MASVEQILKTPGHVLVFRKIVGLCFRRGNLLLFFVVSCTYFAAGIFSRLMAIPDHNIGAFWLPAGIAVATAILKGDKALPGIFFGAVLLNLAAMRSLPISLEVGFCSTLEAAVGAYFVARCGKGVNAFTNTGGFARFVFYTGILTTAFFAGAGVSCLTVGGLIPFGSFWSSWFHWWTGDMLGVVLAGPFIVLLFGHKHHSFSFWETVEVMALLTGLSTICAVNFGPPIAAWIPRSGFQYVCAPFYVWAAIRFCPLEVAGTTLVGGLFSMWGSLHGFGPFGDATILPIFRVGLVLIPGVTAMLGAIAWAQQRKYLQDVLCLYYRSQEARKLGEPPDASETQFSSLASAD